MGAVKVKVYGMRKVSFIKSVAVLSVRIVHSSSKIRSVGKGLHIIAFLYCAPVVCKFYLLLCQCRNLCLNFLHTNFFCNCRETLGADFQKELSSELLLKLVKSSIQAAKDKDRVRLSFLYHQLKVDRNV